MTSPTELAVQRRATAAFVAADPTAGGVWRAPRTPNGAGGTRRGTPVLVPSTVIVPVRLVPQGNKGETGERHTFDGKLVAVTHHLVGPHDLDVQRGDEYRTAENVSYEVLRVWRPGNYETKAEVYDG